MSALVLSATVIFARHVYIGYEQAGVWQEAWWPSLAVWLPFYLALMVQAQWRLPVRLLHVKRLYHS
jgi:hypothetical protein